MKLPDEPKIYCPISSGRAWGAMSRDSFDNAEKSKELIYPYPAWLTALRYYLREHRARLAKIISLVAVGSFGRDLVVANRSSRALQAALTRVASPAGSRI